ncbi:hypothetical protein [Sphingopyxis sp. 22461]|uniref:hypothetical protein n=1 Tax=Sphingopyxis sp. 22461 TaxID=3453923 RepID=UPI003F850CFD
MDEEIGPQNNGPLQRKRTKTNGWTKARRAAFLEELAMSCNVRRAHASAEMGLGSAYRLRRRDPLFARQWQEALELGYERLELALVRRALEAVDELTLDEGKEPVEKMSVAQAIALLRQHRASVERGGATGRRSQPREIATQEETDAVLIKRIGMVLRQRALRAERGGPAALPSPEYKVGAPDAPDGACG